jgi:hypothetical protein
MRLPAARGVALTQRHSQQMPWAVSQVSPSGLNTVQGAGEGGACKQRSAQHIIGGCCMHGEL